MHQNLIDFNNVVGFVKIKYVFWIKKKNFWNGLGIILLILEYVIIIFYWLILQVPKYG